MSAGNGAVPEFPAGKTAASGDGGKPGLPAAGREAAVNADKENRMMYNPAVRCIFTSCVNRDGSKRSTGGANQDWMRFCGFVSEQGVRLYLCRGSARLCPNRDGAVVSERGAGFAQPFQFLARQIFLQAQENLAVIAVEPRQFFRRQHIFVNQLFINRSQG